VKVWLVSIVDVSMHSLRHICLSEKIALRRFEELRLELIEQNKEMIAHDIEEGIDPSAWIEDNKRLEFWTPDSVRYNSGETPHLETMEVEP